MNILSLNDYALEAVLEKLSYSEIAKLRQALFLPIFKITTGIDTNTIVIIIAYHK